MNKQPSALGRLCALLSASILLRVCVPDPTPISAPTSVQAAFPVTDWAKCKGRTWQRQKQCLDALPYPGFPK